jgi:hypothetical protein
LSWTSFGASTVKVRPSAIGTTFCPRAGAATGSPPAPWLIGTPSCTAALRSWLPWGTLATTAAVKCSSPRGGTTPSSDAATVADWTAAGLPACSFSNELCQSVWILAELFLPVLALLGERLEQIEDAGDVVGVDVAGHHHPRSSGFLPRSWSIRGFRIVL